VSRLIAATLITGTALLALAGGLRDASAHARYEDSTPARGAILQDPPAQVEITFSQEIQRISGSYGIEVNRDRGSSVTAGPAEVNDDDRSKMSVALQSNLEPGRYVVTWRNVSDEDGDPADGAFSFYYDVEPTAVDLANDEQLAQVGEEQGTPTPLSTASAGASPTPADSAPTAQPTADNDGGENDDDGGGSTIWVAVGIGVAAAVLAGAAVMFLRSRRS
jgi:methionine-rich copper-binding protein CopC